MSAFPAFSPTVLTGFYMLGITLIVHVFLVSLIMGIAIIVPFLEWQSYRKNDKDLMTLSQRLFKFLAVSDLVAGVWATWLTVVLAGYWSTLLYVAVTNLFVPITIAIIGIIISIPAMAAYYYLWGKVSHLAHLMIGVLMIVGTILVPVGINTIFSFINYPLGLGSSNALMGFLNPLYPAFTLHRIFAGITMAALAFSSIYAIKLRKGNGGAEKALYLKGAKYGLYIGLPSLALQTLTGIVYGSQLAQFSPYIASVLFGGLFVDSIPTYYNFVPIFSLFLVLVAVMWITGVYNLLELRKMTLNKYALYLLLAVALIEVPIAEFLNGAARFPYFVIDGTSGLPASIFINTWITIPADFALVAILFSAALMGLFAYVLYAIFLKAFKAKL